MWLRKEAVPRPAGASREVAQGLALSRPMEAWEASGKQEARLRVWPEREAAVLAPGAAGRRDWPGAAELSRWPAGALVN
jgi:hypothetical protein